MRFDRGSIMAPIGSPTKITGRDQMSIGGLGGGMDFDTSQFLTKSDLPTFDTSQFLTKSDMPTRFDPSQLEQQIGGLQKQIGNIPQFDDSAIRRMIEDNQRSIGNIPSFDPSNLQSGIAGLTDRLDNLNIPEYKAPDLSGFARIDDLPKFNPKDYRDDFLSIAREGINIPKYEAPDLSGFARKEDLPVFDKEAFEKEMLGKMQGSINIPKFDRDALIKDIRSGIDIPKPPSFDREKLIEDIRGGIDIPQAPDLSAFDTRFADMQKRVDELSQRQAPPQNENQLKPEDYMGRKNFVGRPPQPVEPIMAQPLVPGSGNVPPMQNNGLIRDPNGNMVDPNNLPDNMVLEQDPNFGPSVRFADDYVLQPSDQGYMSNDSGRFNRGFEPIIRPPQVPPKRDDFMSIGGPGGGFTAGLGGGGLSMDEMRGVGLNTGFKTSLGGTPLPPVAPTTTGELTPPPGITSATPTVQPAPTEPAAVAPTAGADPTQTQMPMGAIDPVLLQQQTSEKLTDPLIRSLYFGTQDSPGFYQQLQQAGANLIGSDVPLQQTAGLSPLELLARQKAVAGLGGFEPFLQQNRDLVDQAIAQSRRAEELQDPYYTQAEEIYKDTMGAYDPSMTQQFYNPYEDAVVQKTIQDVMEAGDKQDIASRAREISSGAFGGSRARLGAEERRESLGEGLAQALGNIRSQGFQSAQATGLGEFARQQAAKRTGAQGLMGIGVGRGSAASQLGSQLAGYGSQIGGIGQTQEQMRAGQRGELSGYGGIGRGIAETGLGRIYQQQLGQQQRPLGVLGQIGSMLPGYQASGTQIDSQYGMPTDPSAAGLGAAFSAYGAFAPRQGQT